MNKEVFYFANSEKFVTREMGSEMVMVPITNKVADMTSVLTLNEVGAEIIKILEEPLTFNNVVQKLLNIYDADEETIAADVEAFLKEAVNKRVIEIR
jgi:hypothetical protein